MDLNFTKEEEDFRGITREWIGENLPRVYRDSDTNAQPTREDRVEWYQRLAQKGWLCQSWPEEDGGPGWSLAQQFIFNEESGLAGAPTKDMGVSMIGPLIIEFGTPEQKERYLPKIVAAEELWCQGYSEPNAGSDLANLALRAVRDGDDYVLNGQKIWTSGADESDMIFVLVRTDTHAKKKQAGITFMVASLNTPGIEIRPIRQITDESHFFETFFTDARVPAANVIGEENQGWTLAKRLLAHERSASGRADRFRKSLEALTELARTTRLNGEFAMENSGIRQRISALHMELEALKALGYRSLTQLLQGKMPGPESSIVKLYGSELFQRITDLALEIQGPDSQLWNTGDLSGAEINWPKTAAWSRAYTIFGGTSEIQRNIIAERVLGLPRK